MKAYLLLLVSLPFLMAADVYKHTADDGTVEYSDKPQQQQDSLELVPLPTIQSTPQVVPQQNQSIAIPTSPVSSMGIYLQSPQDDQAVRSNNGELIILVAVSDEISAHRLNIQLELDQLRLPEQYLQTRIRLQGIERGTHTLRAMLVTENGKIIARSERIRFHLLRHSVLFPQ